MPKLHHLVLCAGWTLAVANNASGDVVTLANGDRITGTVVKKGEGTLKFKTGYAGEIDIKWSEVAHLKMDEPAEAVLVDESLVTISEVAGNAPGDGGGAKGGGAAAYHPTEVETIKPDPWELGSAGKFTGRANFAMQLESGNSNTDEIDFDFEMEYRKGDHRFDGQGQLEYDKTNGSTTKQDWLAVAKYDYFFLDDTYFSFTYGGRQEKYAGLNLRQFGGPGIGRQFFEGKPTSLLAEVGVFAIDEDFIDQPDNTFWGPAGKLKFQHEMFGGKLTFYHNHYAIHSAEDTDKYLWHSWTGFRFPIVNGIVGSIEYEFEYDSQPAIEAENEDNTFRLKLGYEW